MDRFMNWSGLVPSGGIPASQDSIDAKAATATLLDKSNTIMQQTAKNLQGADWGQALRRFFAGAAGIFVAIICGIYYTAFFPFVSEPLGCRCDWEPLLQAVLIIVSVLPLALWSATKFHRL
jgi:hypothetical protein